MSKPLVFDPDLDAGTWYESESVGGRYLIRALSPARTRAVRKAAGLPAYAPAGERLTEEQQSRLETEMVEWLLADWQEVEDRDGNAVPCTRENKVRLMNAHEPLTRLIPAWARLAYHAALQRDEGELGNSSGSSPGSVTTPRIVAAPSA